MTQRSYWLFGIVGFLLLSWLVMASPWSGGPELQVVVKHSAVPAGAEPEVLIGLNQAYDVRAVVVHRMVQDEDGAWEVPKYGLESDPVWKVIPRGADTRELHAFMYGKRPQGMRNEVRPVALVPEGRYRVTIDAVQGGGTVDFGGVPDPVVEAEGEGEPGTTP
ncbi:MAG: hypothetical protein RLN76_02455 [Phycisphaeraceae bacterium]